MFSTCFRNAPPEEEPIVIDLGCGPFTGGFAIASVFDSVGRKPRFDYIGVDRSCAMQRCGERLAVAAKKLCEVHRYWWSDVASVSWDKKPGWHPVIVIVSYLLASPTLDAARLIAELNKLLEKIGRGSVTVFYTNSEREDANRNYPSFRKALLDTDFALHSDDVEQIERRGNFRYALFHRPKQHTLPLGGD